MNPRIFRYLDKALVAVTAIAITLGSNYPVSAGGGSITLSPLSGDNQNAITQALAKYSVVNLTAGTFNHSGVIVVPGSHTLQGAGASTKLVATKATGAVELQSSNATVANLSLEYQSAHLTLASTSDNPNSACVSATNAVNPVISNVIIENAPVDAIDLSNCSGGSVSGCIINQAYGRALNIAYCKNMTLSSNKIPNGASGTLLEMYMSSNMTFSNNVMHDNLSTTIFSEENSSVKFINTNDIDGYLFFFLDGALTFSGNNFSNGNLTTIATTGTLTFNNKNVLNNFGMQIDASMLSSGNISSNTIQNIPVVAGYAEHAVTWNGPASLTFQNNTISNISGSALVACGSGALNISGNTISNVWKGSPKKMAFSPPSFNTNVDAHPAFMEITNTSASSSVSATNTCNVPTNHAIYNLYYLGKKGASINDLAKGTGNLLPDSITLK